MIMDEKLNFPCASIMLEEGIFVICLSFYVVASGKVWIRILIKIAHHKEDIDRTPSLASSGKQAICRFEIKYSEIYGKIYLQK